MKSKLFAIAAFSALVLACSPRIIQVPVRDTVTVTKVETIRDTVISVQVPEESRIVETRDTSSILETSVAVSEARICSGILYHSLNNKKTALKTHLPIRKVEKIEYQSKEIPIEVKVPEPYIPEWVWYVLTWAILSTSLIAVIVFVKLRK